MKEKGKKREKNLKKKDLTSSGISNILDRNNRIKKREKKEKEKEKRIKEEKREEKDAR